MNTPNDNDNYLRLESALDALLTLDIEARAVQLSELEKNAPEDAAALRRWLSAIDASEGFLEPVTDTRIGKRIGAWLLLRMLGHGGMGTVYLAERADGVFEKQVAVKFIRGDSPNLRERFAQERQVLALLEHPGIARLLDGGITIEGDPYLVTEYIDGQSLDRWCEQQQPNLEVRLALFQRVAEAVAYAHANLVVHRDLKPSNILVEADGRPRLVDFGIAKLIEPGHAAQTVERVLTPEFAAPEQLTGTPITTRTDIYVLGALLYWLLTGKTPLATRDTSLATLVDRVCNEVPLPPSSVAALPQVSAKRLRGDLDAIVLKALAKSPEERYLSVEAMLADLDAAMHFRAVSARHVGQWDAARRFLRRHRLGATLAAGMVLTLAIGLVGTLWQANIAAHERDTALDELSRNEALTQFLLRLFRDTSLGDEKLSASEFLARGALLMQQSGPVDPDARARITYVLADLQGTRGNPKAEADLLQSLLADYDAKLSERWRANAHCQLANAYVTMSQIEDAAREIEQGLALAEKLYGSQRITLANCLTAQSKVLIRQGDREGAIAANQRALAEALQLPRSMGTTVLLSTVEYTLAGALHMADRSAEALPLADSSYQRMVEAGYGESNDAATSLSLLASIYKALGRMRDADRVYSQALTLAERVGGRTTQLADGLVNYAKLKNGLEQAHAARELALRAIAIETEVSGDKSVIQAGAQLELGRADAQLGEYERAFAELKRAQEGFIAALGPNEVVVHFPAMVRAKIHLKRGDFKQAQREIDGVIQAFREAGIEILLTYSLPIAVEVAQANRDIDGAMTLANESLALARKFYPADHWYVAWAESQLAATSLAQGKSDKARELLEHALPILTRELGPTHSYVQQTQATLAGLH